MTPALLIRILLFFFLFLAIDFGGWGGLSKLSFKGSVAYW